MASRNTSTSSPLALEIILETGEDNPGKRRRNRARVSCINCYASKRKCDRKRPCTRCISLGLTGLCVYELDDPSSRNKKDLKETTHLKNRIAELESVLRQLKKKPHPRWTCPGGLTHDPGLVAARRKSRRRPRQDLSSSASVETFFAAVAESDGDEDGVKLEGSSSFVPEFTPSELGHPDDPALIPAQLQGSMSTPFTFVDESHPEISTPLPPLASFIQSVHGEKKIEYPTESQATSIDSTPASIEAATLSSPLGSKHRLLASSVVHQHPSSSPSVDMVADPLRTTSIAVQTSPVSSHPQAVTAQHSSSISVKRTDACRCINTTTNFTPLLHFAIALRTSREALQGHHASSSDCDLFRRILELESQIFSAAPSTLETSHHLSQAHDSHRSTVDYVPEPAFAPSELETHTQQPPAPNLSFPVLSQVASTTSLRRPHLYPFLGTHGYDPDVFASFVELPAYTVGSSETTSRCITKN